MSDVNGPGEPGAMGGDMPLGAGWGDSEPPLTDAEVSERRQRNALIGLAVASTIVLLIGGVAFLASRSGGEPDATIDSTVVPTAAATTLPETTTTTSTTTTSTTTTLPAPVEALADAGDDLAVDAGEVATLTALAVTEGAEDEDVMWRQLAGPDVTGGVGALGGRAVSFGAPDQVVTLEFELIVSSNDRAATAAEAVDTVTVRVFEQADAAVFVDAERGSPAGDGSMESPLRSLADAASRATDGADVYARSVGTYAESTPIRLGTGSSLYGGFDENWNRDRSQRIEIDAASVGIIVDGDGDRVVSAIELTGADAAPGSRAIGIRVSDGETVTIEDSRIVSGRAGDGLGSQAEGLAGTAVGVLVTDTGEIRLERSTVNSGNGGDGAAGLSADDGSNGAPGEDGDGIDPGEGGAADGDLRPGGEGGDGATNGPGDDAQGDAGGAGGQEEGDDGEPGVGGAGGSGGAGGDGGSGVFDGDAANPVGASGLSGGDGDDGAGGGGGGGGASGFGPGLATGGAGGGGGAGGVGGVGGAPGGGGGGSVGVWAVRVDRVVILESLVAAGRGGDGAVGASGSAAGDGGPGGSGVEGGEGIAVAGNGGGGGGGGAGGVGGAGGGGAGGPSYGMLTSDVDAVEIMATTIRGGGGGTGADGGIGGANGLAGESGTEMSGGDGGSAGLGDAAARGQGASGGSSFGWFDVDAATQTFDEANFIEGVAGTGGQGSTSGDTGLEGNANVDAGG